jgi:hypothetical protein
MKTTLLAGLWLAPIAVLAQPSAWRLYSLHPLPPSLEKVRGIHPRLYLETARISELRQAIQTTHARMWQEVLERADRAVKQGPPAYRERDKDSGDEQLWQREVGNTMPTLAMAWVLSGDRQYLDAARQWALASCGYQTWGLGRIDGLDLAATGMGRTTSCASWPVSSRTATPNGWPNRLRMPASPHPKHPG